jgi:riboflavin kinase/FMN adenylyltransferase
MTFEPHPSRVLKQNGHPPLITMYEQKMELISKHGMDVVISVPFTKEFANISAKAFVEDLLINRIGMKAIVVGKDYAFGKNREGNLDFLKKSSVRLGFEVIVWNWVSDTVNQFDRVSSTIIRELVMDGKVASARQPLGRYYQIRGTVETGRDRGGKLLGFPTANIHLKDELCPKMGVYAVTVECRDRFYKGVANIGYSPTFEDHTFTVEVHLLDFNQNIYGENIRVNFIERLRDEMKFSNIAQLIDQIKKDIEKAKQILDH